MVIRDINDSLRLVVEGLSGRMVSKHRFLKTSEVQRKPHGEDAIVVSYLGRSLGILARSVKGWKGTGPRTNTGVFGGPKGKDKALSALIKASPYGVVYLDGTLVS